jgi:hypothetical protein
MATQKELAISLISKEYDMAIKKFRPFNSPHEGYAVISEELDELWDDVKANIEGGKEAVQVGAMAVRFLVDCCNMTLRGEACEQALQKGGE